MSCQKRPLPPGFDGQAGLGHDADEARKRRPSVNINNNGSSNTMYSPSLFYGGPDGQQPPYFGPGPAAAASFSKPGSGPSTIASAGGQAALVYPPSALRHRQPAPQAPAGSYPPAQQAPNNARVGLAAIRIAGHSVRDLVPSFQTTGMGPDDMARRHLAVMHELRHQQENPPVLPPSRVADLPPKQDIPDFIPLPDQVDDKTRSSIQDHNNRVSAISQRIDRERNNMAAKKSRALRIESRDMYRQLFIEATAKLFHHRFVAALDGRDPSIWERLPERFRRDLVELAERGAEQVETKAVETKKQDEARKRRERARARCERRAAHDHDGQQQQQQQQGNTPGLAQIGTAETDVFEHLQVVSPRLGN
ncbi:hypothetical protein CDD82_2901 [Ophiocordyceps australis]|uniref:Uncharacterized protein n=1 Tax=Ophiocordyceps australis TaxID=1399860 RepID=A0A2C5XDG7_9HYPO|nr:hypothetical protein CDD82_2901 [Ophiocordyceps australis]